MNRGLSRPVLSVDRRTVTLAVIILGAIAVGVAFRLSCGALIRDDAFITLRYADRIAHGQGFTYNPGEHVLGTTTPLFALLVAFFAWLGLPPEGVSVGIGIGADVAAIAVLGLIASRFLSATGVAFAALAYAVFSPLVMHAVSGMETPLYILLILVTVWLYSNGRMSLAGASAGAVFLTRPDGALLALVLFAHSMLTSRRDLPRALLTFTVVVAPWLIFALIYFGSPIPQSVIAKAAVMTTDPLASLRNWLMYFSDDSHRRLVWLVPFFLIGVHRSRKNSAIIILVGWALLYAAAFVTLGKFVFPEWGFEWYLVPLLAPFALGVGAGMDAVIAGVIRRLRIEAKAPSVVVVILVALVLVGFYASVLQYSRQETTLWISGRETLYEELADSLAKMGIQDEMVAATEIGAFGYYYPGPVLDLCGLVSPKVLGSNTIDVLRSTRPDWIMSYSSHLPYEVTNSLWFRQEYKPVQTLANWEGRLAVLYRHYPPVAEPALSGPRSSVANSMQLLGLETTVKTLNNEKKAVGITFQWSTSTEMTDHYVISVQLQDESGRKLGQHDSEPQDGQYPTNEWKPGELVLDKHNFTVDNAQTDDNCWLAIGVNKAGAITNPESWSDISGLSLGHSLRIPLAALTGQWNEEFSHSRWSYPSEDAQSSPRPVLAAAIELLGLDLKVTPQGDKLAINITSAYRVIKDIDRHYTLFFHLQDQEGKLIGQYDSEPFGGRYPTTLWVNGTTLIDRVQILMNSEDFADAVSLSIGAYRSGAVADLQPWDNVDPNWPQELRVPIAQLATRSQ